MEVTKRYEYEGVIYDVTESEDTHELLKDEQYFCEYFKTHANNLELSTVKEDKENVDFCWNNETTNLLISEYRKRKMDFRNSKVKKIKLWREIVTIFADHGHFVSEHSLDRKFRNLKHHYKSCLDKNRRYGGRKRKIQWEYFNLFEDLFRDDKKFHSPPLMSSFKLIITPDPLSCSPEPEPEPEPEIEPPDSKISISTRHSPGPSSPTPPLNVTEIPTPTVPAKRSRKSSNPLHQIMDSKEYPGAEDHIYSQTSKAAKMNELYVFRKKILQLEQEKLEELKKIRVISEEQLNVQKQRNELMKKILKL